MLGKTETKVGIFIIGALSILVYMGFHIGPFSCNGGRYSTYTLYFDDISGLTHKAKVKIAGVTVGWISDLMLSDQKKCAQVDVMIAKQYALYQNAYGMVRQEGLIGPFYLELVPGTPTLPKMEAGAALVQPNMPTASVDALMQTCAELAHDVRDIAGSFKQAFAGQDGANEIKELVGGVKTVVNQLKDEVLPTFQDSITKIAEVCDRDFSNFADRVAYTAAMMQDASDHMKTSFDAVNEIADNINEGRGCIGQLMQDDKLYKDMQYTSGTVANAFRRFNELYFTYDGHVENMFDRASFSCFKNAKGIFNVRIYPRSDYFYLVGVTTSQQGYIKRTTTFKEFTDDCLNEICPENCDLPDWAKYQYLFTKSKQRVKRNAWSVDLQFGKIYRNIALRAGLIEGTGGLAVDVFLPFNENHGLISTFKIYDFRGQNRIDDERPHLKWINRLFLFRHVYLAVGFDDFVSKCNASAFLGAGFRFGEDDLKWFWPNFVGTG